jgi:hypothetical protein
MFFDRNEMQPLAARRILAPGAPGGEEAQPEAESGFQDRERAPALPAPRQAVALQENVLRLREAALGAVIDVAEFFGIRRAVPEPEDGASARSAMGWKHPHFALRHGDDNAVAAEAFEDGAIEFAGRGNEIGDIHPGTYADRH